MLFYEHLYSFEYYCFLIFSHYKFCLITWYAVVCMYLTFQIFLMGIWLNWEVLILSPHFLLEFQEECGYVPI